MQNYASSVLKPHSNRLKWYCH